jgi:hypothetical protein
MRRALWHCRSELVEYLVVQPAPSPCTLDELCNLDLGLLAMPATTFAQSFHLKAGTQNANGTAGDMLMNTRGQHRTGVRQIGR